MVQMLNIYYVNYFVCNNIKGPTMNLLLLACLLRRVVNNVDIGLTSRVMSGSRGLIVSVYH